MRSTTSCVLLHLDTTRSHRIRRVSGFASLSAFASLPRDDSGSAMQIGAVGCSPNNTIAHPMMRRMTQSQAAGGRSDAHRHYGRFAATSPTLAWCGVLLPPLDKYAIVACRPTGANVAYLPLWQAGVGTSPNSVCRLARGNSLRLRHSLLCLSRFPVTP